MLGSKVVRKESRTSEGGGVVAGSGARRKVWRRVRGAMYPEQADKPAFRLALSLSLLLPKTTLSNHTHTPHSSICTAHTPLAHFLLTFSNHTHSTFLHIRRAHVPLTHNISSHIRLTHHHHPNYYHSSGSLPYSRPPCPTSH